jgi:hypothetical protein
LTPPNGLPQLTARKSFWIQNTACIRRISIQNARRVLAFAPSMPLPLASRLRSTLSFVNPVSPAFPPVPLAHIVPMTMFQVCSTASRMSKVSLLSCSADFTLSQQLASIQNPLGFEFTDVLPDWELAPI